MTDQTRAEFFAALKALMFQARQAPTSLNTAAEIEAACQRLAHAAFACATPHMNTGSLPAKPNPEDQ